MSFESESENIRRRSQENRENQAETREGEVDPELQKAAAMERADFMIKGVKSSQKQMQNIARHMQEVEQAIRQLRTQLQLAESNIDPVSIAQDKKRIEELKKKISVYKEDLDSMRGDLIIEQVDDLKKQSLGLSDLELNKRAEELVEKLIQTMQDT